MTNQIYISKNMTVMFLNVKHENVFNWISQTRAICLTHPMSIFSLTITELYTKL